MVTSTPCRNASTSNCPLEFTNFIRFSEARLHAVSSRNMYSEQGFDALIRAVLLHVCQRLMVESYRMPGAPQRQVESPILGETHEERECEQERTRGRQTRRSRQT